MHTLASTVNEFVIKELVKLKGKATLKDIVL